MSVSPVLVFSPSTEVRVEPGEARPTQAVSEHIPGSGSSRESGDSQNQDSQSIEAQDEVKVQMEPPGEIAVYKFLDQNGSLVLQVPPQQWLELAQAIDQELAQESAPNKVSGAEGGHPWALA